MSRLNPIPAVATLVLGAALAAAGGWRDMQLGERRAREESALRHERERLRDDWTAAVGVGVSEAFDQGQPADFEARMERANATLKAGIDAAAQREVKEFEAYLGERGWTLLAVFTGAVAMLASGGVLAVAWLGRQPAKAPAVSGPPER